jgi:tripartite-type tricarboxylate transporter receptor subunit TctC
MKDRLGSTVLSFVSALAFLGCVPQASAQTGQAITLIAPTPPGGNIDLLARIVAPHLSEFIGKPVVVVNRPGASQKIGIHALLNAPRDGETLAVVGPASMTINPLLDKQLGYDPLKDFAYLTNAVSYSLVLAAHPSLKVRSLKELIDYGRGSPGKLVYGTGGLGSSIHLAARELWQRTGITGTAVHYKGDGPAFQDFIAGHVPVMLSTVASAKPYVESGRLIALATTGTERMSEFPDTPTFKESGVPGLADYTFRVWLGFLAAAGIPSDAAQKLQSGLVRALRVPEVAKSLQAKGLSVVASRPEEFQQTIRSELQRNKAVIDRDGIQLR